MKTHTIYIRPETEIIHVDPRTSLLQRISRVTVNYGDSTSSDEVWVEGGGGSAGNEGLGKKDIWDWEWDWNRQHKGDEEEEE